MSPRELNPESVVHSVAAAADMLLWVGPDGRLIDANAAAVATYGWPRDQLLDKSIHDLDLDFPPLGWERHWQQLVRCGSISVTVRHDTASGTVLPLEIVDSHVRWGTQEFSFLVARDISRRSYSDERMRLMQFSVDSMTDSAFWISRDGKILYANDAACRNLDYASDELLELDIEAIDPGFPTERWEQFWRDLEQRQRVVIESVWRARDGRQFPVEIISNHVRCNDQEFNCAFVRDISKRRHSEQRLQHLATHDALTGLPNRTLLNDRLEQALRERRREQARLALLFIDLDQFKLVNDDQGHRVGDALLVHVGQVLQEIVRESDTVARLGGDEFVVLLDNLEFGEHCERVASAIIDSFVTRPFVDERRFDITSSIGIAVFPDDGDSAEALFMHADIAMYRAKELGGNRCQFFSPAIGEQVNRRVELRSGLRRALEQDEFVLHYQPILALASGRLVSVEALLRWQTPDAGLVMPGHFIAAAEENGLIEPIGAWVIRRACRQLRAWLDAGLAPVPIAVNVSTQQLRNRALLGQLRDALAEFRVAPRLLSIEVTESMMMANPVEAAKILTEVRSLGLTVAIDDFGTGHSSLGYLKRLPVDTLKIDRSFVAGIIDDLDDVIIVKTIIAMAHHLGFQVLAEGIERPEQHEFLVGHGCDLGQGYLFDRPLTPERLVERLRDGMPKPA